MSDRLDEVREIIAGHLDAIRCLFKGTEVTLVARSTWLDDADVLVTDDDPFEVIRCIRKLAQQERQDLLDPRQRAAASLILAAVPMPGEMAAVAHQWSEAASVAPANSTAQAVFLNDRKAALQRAREIIDELLSEAP